MSLDEFAKRNVKEKELEDEIEKKGMAPVGSLMFTEVERRMDVFVFRCCFVHSVYEARRLIIHGYVTLNGNRVRLSISIFFQFVFFLNKTVFLAIARASQHSSCAW